MVVNEGKFLRAPSAVRIEVDLRRVAVAMTDSHWILGNPEDALGTLGAQIFRHDQMLQLLSHTIMLGNSCQIANELETGLGNSP